MKFVIQFWDNMFYSLRLVGSFSAVTCFFPQNNKGMTDSMFQENLLGSGS